METGPTNRLAYLQEKLDFYRTEKEKLLVLQKQEQDSIIKISTMLEPTLLLAHSMLYRINESYNLIETQVRENLDKMMDFFTEHIEKIFVNYLAITRLHEEILELKDTHKKGTLRMQFNDNLDLMRQSQPQLIENFQDSLMVEYNQEIDEGFTDFVTHFKNLIKLIDSLHIKLAQIHSVSNKSLEIGNVFTKFGQIAQYTEDQYTKFIQNLHLEAEPFLSQIGKRIGMIFDDTVKFIVELESRLTEKEDFLNDQYNSLIEIRDSLITELITHVENQFHIKIQNMDSGIENFTKYCQSQFDLLEKVKPAPDSTITVDLAKIDNKIEELTKKIAEIRKISNIQ